MVSSHNLPEIRSNFSGNCRLQKDHALQRDCSHCRVSKYCLPALCILHNQSSNKLDHIYQHQCLLRQYEHLIHRNDPQQYLYAIHSGCCKGYFIDDSGREHVSGFYYPGDIIGLESIFHHKFLINIVALDTSEICYISLPRFKELLIETSDLREQFLNIFSRQLWQSYAMKGNYKATEKVIQFLLDISHHAKSLSQSEVLLNLPMGRHDIANYLGLSSETISRILTRLANKKLIEVNRNSIKLCDLPRLHALATYSCVLDF